MAKNRFLVKRGLERINGTQNLGIRALADSANLKLGAIDTESLSFGIIPRLNVAGRLGSAAISLELLITESMSKARSLADEIEGKNRERREITRRAVAEAERQIDTQNGIPPILIVKSEDWIPGVLGLIAGRLSEAYYRPAIAVSLGEHTSRASARSISEFDIIAALNESRNLFERHGGHPQAAGFTIPTASLPCLERNLNSVAAKQLEGRDLNPSIDIDCEVQLSVFTPRNFQFIQSLAPFGKGNPAPVFLTRGVRVLEARLVGANRQHLKLRLAQGGTTLDAIAFNLGHKVNETRRGIDVVYSIGLDTWGGRPKLQLTIQDPDGGALYLLFALTPPALSPRQPARAPLRNVHSIGSELRRSRRARLDDQQRHRDDQHEDCDEVRLLQTQRPYLVLSQEGNKEPPPPSTALSTARTAFRQAVACCAASR